MREGGATVTLLEGVTGSGKTEVYFEAVAEAVRPGRQALILMPEIALTAQFLDRFAARFGVRPAAWHSGVTGRRRERLYLGIAAGEVEVVAGARSALFLPYRDLGLIVVDEEHEAAYKQEDGVHYHARDMAVVRGRIEGAPVILASATPSIETRVNAERGRYRHVRLPERFGGRSAAADPRRRPQARGDPDGAAGSRRPCNSPSRTRSSAASRRSSSSTAAATRRSPCAAPARTATNARTAPPGSSSTASAAPLVCHHCGHVERTPQACIACGSLDSLVPCGPGVERIAEEVAELFPERRTIVLSSDFPGGTERLRSELAAIAAGEFDIVIGTQLVAKGHNFPLMTLVGVLDADIGLTSGDPRAAERTFQLLQQVTGRAGRGEKPGRALVQTWQPEHPVIAALISGDAERFYREETRVRELAGLPPFGRLAALIVSAAEREAAEAHARAMAQVGGAAARRHGPRARRGAARPHPRPLPLPAPRQDGAGGRPAGLSERLARPLPEGARQARVSIDVDPQSVSLRGDRFSRGSRKARRRCVAFNSPATPPRNSPASPPCMSRWGAVALALRPPETHASAPPLSGGMSPRECPIQDLTGSAAVQAPLESP